MDREENVYSLNFVLLGNNLNSRINPLARLLALVVGNRYTGSLLASPWDDEGLETATSYFVVAVSSSLLPQINPSGNGEEHLLESIQHA